jgi:hypothetical protein
MQVSEEAPAGTSGTGPGTSPPDSNSGGKGMGSPGFQPGGILGILNRPANGEAGARVAAAAASALAACLAASASAFCLHPSTSLTPWAAHEAHSLAWAASSSL